MKQAEKIEIKNPRKDIRKIQQKRKKLRMELKTTKNKLEKHILLQRVKILKEHIIDKLKESRAAKTSKVAESIKTMQTMGVKYGRYKGNLKRKNKIHTKY